MKKLLALVLALVMTLGLATVSSSAAFSDADSIEYKEAVDVMSAVGVLAGMDDGSFQPTGSLTREQGAKIITYILLGGKTAGDTLKASSAPFSDVAADRWSAGSIQYCVANGIIAGIGNNKFDPTGELTGYAFAKMLLGALGYSAEVEGLVGNEWQVNTAKLIQATGLSNDIANFLGSATVTREVAAQMGLNALKADMVEYSGGVNVSAGDASVVVNSTRSAVTSAAAYAGAIEDDRPNTMAAASSTNPYTVQLGEQVFGGNLKIDDTVTDAFGRPSAMAWTFKNEKVSDVVVSDSEYLLGTFNSSVKYKELYSTLGNNVIDKTLKLEMYVDGLQVVEMSRANTATAWGDAAIQTADEGSQNGFSFTNLTKTNSTNIGYDDNETTYTSIADDTTPTGTGVKTEVYAVYDDANSGYNVTIAIVNTWVAIASADYNSTTNRLYFTKQNGAGDAAYTLNPANYVSSDDFANVANVKKDDKILYTAAWESGTTYEIQSVTIPESLTALSATAYTASSNVTLGGTKYSYSRMAPVKNTAFVMDGSSTYDIWLDGEGNIIYVDGTSLTDYVYLPAQSYALDGNVATGQNLISKAVFTDGTKATITIDKFIVTGGATSTTANDIKTALDGIGGVKNALTNAGNGNGTGIWAKYSKSGDKYTLTYTAADNKLVADGNYSSSTANLGTTVANSKTTFIVYNEGSKTYGVYTGLAALPKVTTTYDYAAVNDNGYALFVYMSAAANNITDSSSTTSTAYIFKPATVVNGYDSANDCPTYTYDAIIDGEVTTITLKNALVGTNKTAGGLYTWTSTTDGYPNVTRVTTNDTSKQRYVLTEKDKTLAFSNGTFNDGANYLTVADDAVVYMVDLTKSSISAELTSMSSIVNDAVYGASTNFDGWITIEAKSSSDGTVKAAYFVFTGVDEYDLNTLGFAKAAVAESGTTLTAKAQNSASSDLTTTGYNVSYQWQSATDSDGAGAASLGTSATQAQGALTTANYVRVTITISDAFGRSLTYSSPWTQIQD